jgi:hypothetical protein
VISDIEQRSTTWTSIGFVPGSGTSTSPKEYSFGDSPLEAGRYAYRLRQVNRDGSYECSGELEIEVGQVPVDVSVIRAYPNPFNPQTTVEFRSAVSGAGAVKVYDLLGREVALLYQGEIVAGTKVERTLDGTALPSGMYIIRFETLGRAASTRVVLLK